MIVVAGEALIDLVGEPDGRYRPVPGGSPANVAVALSRLGHRTELLARIGAGRFGQLVRDHLEANRVGLAYAVDADEPATLAVVSLDDAGSAGYDFYVNGTADWAWTPDELPDPLPPDTVALCVGSLAVALEPGATAVVGMIRREAERGAVTIVLDPNLRPSLLGPPEQVRSRIESLVAMAGMVKVSDEDLGWLAPGEAFEDVAGRWLALGPGLVVVTLGAQGAYAVSRSGVEARIPARSIDLVDTVGAGDAFTAGLVDALHHSSALGSGMVHLNADAVHAALDHAGLVAAMTCSRRGADPPTTADLARADAGGALQPGRNGRHT